MMKKIDQGSRLQIQTLINGNVYLELFVKVVPDWRSKSSRLNEFGYEAFYAVILGSDQGRDLYKKKLIF